MDTKIIGENRVLQYSAANRTPGSMVLLYELHLSQKYQFVFAGIVMNCDCGSEKNTCQKWLWAPLSRQATPKEHSSPFLDHWLTRLPRSRSHNSKRGTGLGMTFNLVKEFRPAV